MILDLYIMFNLNNVLSKFLVRVLDRTGHVFQGMGNRSYLNGQYKYNFITIALKEKYILKQIGEILNISESAVCKFITRYNLKKINAKCQVHGTSYC